MRLAARLATTVFVVSVSHGATAAPQAGESSAQSEACAVPLPPNRSWTLDEVWVWEQACLDKVADFSQRV